MSPSGRLCGTRVVSPSPAAQHWMVVGQRGLAQARLGTVMGCHRALQLPSAREEACSPDNPDTGQIAAFFSVLGPPTGPHPSVGSPFVPLKEGGRKVMPPPFHALRSTHPSPPPWSWAQSPLFPCSCSRTLVWDLIRVLPQGPNSLWGCTSLPSLPSLVSRDGYRCGILGAGKPVPGFWC